MKISVSAQMCLQLKECLGTTAHRIGYNHGDLHRAQTDKVPVDLNFEDCDGEDLQKIHAVLTEADDPGARIIKRVLNMINDPLGRTSKANMRHVPEMFEKFFRAHVKQHPDCHYLVRSDLGQKGIAYLPVSVEYHQADHRRSNSSINLNVVFNLHGVFKEQDFSFFQSDMGQTIPELLKQKGLFMMEADDKEAYEKVMERYRAFHKLDKEQMLARGIAFEYEDRGYWWSTPEIDLSPKGNPTKVVLDLTFEKERAVRASCVSTIYKGKDYPVPTHPVLLVFSLARHKHCYVNVANMKPYKYESIRDRLVLPASHASLIDALVTSLDVLQGAEDESEILKSKARSNVILAIGPPGTGKTLTAEVYAEEIKRPLYELAAGQLGSHAQEIEEQLEAALSMSIRLDMPLLINEADVFIIERGTDMEQNAVCAVFLRLIEYHTGLLFLTTNRSNIDSAMRSRCIAEIEYGVPKVKEREELWRVQLRQFGIKFREKEIVELSHVFPSVVGRDIQNLLNLGQRVCIALKKELTVKALGEVAIFKRIEYKPLESDDEKS